MVRTEAPLVERMTLVWHDWFATSKSGVPQGLMLRQNALLRRHALGNFERLALDMTQGPGDAAVAQRHVQQRLEPERELRPRAAGAVLPRRRPRLQRARRPPARPRADRLPQRLDGRRARRASATTTKLHDPKPKRIYGKRGKFSWQEGVRLVTRHRRHPEFMVTKLWGYFIPTKPSAATAQGARAAVRRSAAARCARWSRRSSRTPTSTTAASAWSSRRSCRPRACCAPSGAGSTRAAWAWLCESAGQYLFMPPNVAGWDDTRWLDTATFRARWQMAQHDLQPGAARPRDRPPRPADPAELVRRAAAFWGSPPLSGPVRAGLERYAADTLATADESWKRETYPVLALNALRMLVATSPDYLTS